MTPDPTLSPVCHTDSVFMQDLNQILYLNGKTSDNYFYLLKIKVTLYFLSETNQRVFPLKNVVKLFELPATGPEKYWNIRMFSKL